MKFHVSDENLQSLSIYISGCQKEWGELNKILDKNIGVIEINSSDYKSYIHEKCNGRYLDCFKIIIENCNENNKFTIQIINNILIFNGSRKSFRNFQDLASEFSNNNDENGSHVHLDYIDVEGYDYNWFYNKNIDLILAVRSDF